MAAEVHTEPTEEELGEQPGEQPTSKDYPLEDVDKEDDEEEEEDEEEEDEEDAAYPDFNAIIEESLQTGHIRVKV